MLKQRNRPRKNTPHHVKAIDVKTNGILGRVVDITADGLMLVGKDFLEPGTPFHLRIVLPRMVEGKMDVTVETEVIWSRQDTNPKYFKTGFRFVNLAGNDGFLLEDVMHRMNLVG